MEKSELEKKMDILATEYKKHFSTSELLTLSKIYDRYEDLQQEYFKQKGRFYKDIEEAKHL